MAHILFKHRVNDYKTWKEVFDSSSDFRKSSGEKSYQIFHSIDDSNDLTLLMEWDSAKRARAFLESPELKERMARAGVTKDSEIRLLDQVS